MSLIFKIALILVAFLYASVGHGGASGYLAIFALSGEVLPEEMRSSALILNLFVSAMSFYGFAKFKHFNSKIFLTLILTSIPAAYFGGLIRISGNYYKILLGIFLLFSILKITGMVGKKISEPREMPLPIGLIVGAALGLISGLIGIGGGIILSPIILIFGWANMKTTAGISASFIFVNSAAGLLGQWHSNQLQIHPEIHWWILLVIAGGLLGSISGSTLLSEKQIRWSLAFVLLIAAGKLLVI
jgi:uncharacterized membrane protein YfcA